MNKKTYTLSGEDNIGAEKSFFRIYNSLAKAVYPRIPFTYYWYLVKLVGKSGKSLIDFGCGWGDPVEVLQRAKRRYAVGVDIYKKYLDFVREKNIYDELVLSDLKKYKSKRRFDVVTCFHVLEHLSKNAGEKLVDGFDLIAKNRIVLAMPVGDLPQGEYDGNTHQRHLSSWYPSDLIRRGYKVYGFSPRFIFGKSDVIKKLGVFALFLFVTAYILEPFYIRMPDKCVYMLAIKKK